MFNENQEILVLFIIIVTGLLWKQVRRSASARPASSPLHFLDGAECILNEQDIRSSSPVPLHGRPDQVFQLSDGRILVFDTKRRDIERVYYSDVVQLSVYATILRSQGWNVCKFGVIRIPASPTDRLITLNLLPDNKVVSLYLRYQDIRLGRENVRCTCGKH